MKPGDNDHLYDEEGNCRDITTHDYVFPYGRFEGFKLSEVDDVSYLEWARDSNNKKKPSDWYFNKVVTMRIKELQ